MSKPIVYLRAFQIKSAVKLASARGINTGGNVQKFIDSEVLRKSEPYVPKLTRTLIRSGTINTQIGSGEVIYRTPYARRQYYENAGRGQEGMAKGGRRGKMWFERMKANHLEEILSGAAKIAGGKSRR
ncbi:minor capsid protein [Helcococcus kunzii]|uniref:minor capsid protein n=1 Tax=Helcococcus kunzii TaxID=40091 RepID=UPI0038A1AD51